MMLQTVKNWKTVLLRRSAGLPCVMLLLTAAGVAAPALHREAISTVASLPGPDADSATDARHPRPARLAVDVHGTVFVSDTEHDRIQRIAPGGSVTLLAGVGSRGCSGDGGPALEAELSNPGGVAVDGKGNVFIAEWWSDRVRRISLKGTIATVVGGGDPPDGLGDGGRATRARLYYPSGLAVDAKGSLYIADTDNDRIRKVDPQGTITTIAGTGEESANGDGALAINAALYHPYGVAVDTQGNVFIADTLNSRIRKINPAGTITTVAGSNRQGFAGDGGPATRAQLFHPCGVAVDGRDDLFIADTDNHRVREVDPDGIIHTVVGGSVSDTASDNDPGISAPLVRPGDVAVDAHGDLFIADRCEDPAGVIIRKVSGIAAPALLAARAHRTNNKSYR